MVENFPTVRFVHSGGAAFQEIFSDKWRVLTISIVGFVLFITTAPFFKEYPIYVGSGILGALAMARFTSKSYVDVDDANAAEIVQRLTKSRFFESESGRVWSPPLPKWLYWRDAVVTIDRRADLGSSSYRIAGPYSYLTRLIQGLK